MNRCLKLSMLVALALGTTQAMALNLGQVQVKSALGQPLLAEVPLQASSPRELRNITVRLATDEEFTRAGITDGRTSIPLKFSVVNYAGGKAIRITSSAPVNNPYLDLLLEVGGSTGKSVREVAILLDPPGESSQMAEMAPAGPAPVRPARAAQPVQRSMPVASTPGASGSVGTDGKVGPVQRGQTLTGIAKKTLPAGVDLSQMLLAYKQANPDAFYRDNVNALKSGSVLRIPTAQQAQSVAVAGALARIRQQNSDWRAGSTSKPVAVADAAARTSGKASSGGQASDRSDMLALVPARNGSKSGKGNSGAASASEQQALLRTKESLASLQQQSGDMKSRLKDLGDINDKNKSLLALKDNEIAELRSQLAAARKAANLPSAAAPVSAAPVGDATAAAGVAASASTAAAQPAAPLATSGSTASVAPATATTVITSVPATAATAVASRPLPVTPVKRPVAAPHPAPVVAEQPWYMQPWVWLVAGGVVLLLLLLALLGRRKPATMLPRSESLADRFVAAPALGAADNAPMATGDDVDQDELLDQLAEHPDDIYLHLELVTLYYSRRDVERFEAAAEAMHAHIADPAQDEWQDVLHMGEDLAPHHPLFDHHEVLPPSEETVARQPFDIDEYAADREHEEDHEQDHVDATAAAEQGKVSEYHFNFDLSSPRHPGATEFAAQDVPVHATEPVARIVEPPPLPGAAAHNPVATTLENDSGFDPTEFNDDPVDTKLDLARAYLDMGDAEGARAMLSEVVSEGSQMQRDTAQELLAKLP